MPQRQFFKKKGAFKEGSLDAKIDYGLLFKEFYSEIKARNEKPKTTSFNSRNGYIKRVCYQIGKEIIDEELFAYFEKYLENALPRSKRLSTKQSNLKPENNPFYWCLVCLEEQAVKAGNNAIMGTSRTAKLSRQMRYAFDEGVPTEYLIGFIYQHGGKEALSGAPSSEHDDWEETSEPEHNNVSDSDDWD